MNIRDTARREPVRLSGYTALVVGLMLVAIIGWASELTLQQIVLQVASMALASIGGLEWARAHATPFPPPRPSGPAQRNLEDHVPPDSDR